MDPKILKIVLDLLEFVDISCFFNWIRCNLVILMGRFHVLKEFDEGKRSCRRRLAGHNRRRRKTLPDTVVNGGTLNDESGSSYLLISLLRILSNMHSKCLSHCILFIGCLTEMLRLQQLVPVHEVVF